MRYEQPQDNVRPNDLLGLDITQLRNFARAIPGEQPPILNDEQLLRRAARAGELGHPWDLWLYEAHEGWRNREAVTTANENATMMIALMENLLSRDRENGSQQHFPLPQFFLNIAGHSWSMYDRLDDAGKPALHDDGQSYGIHSLTKLWRMYIEPDKRSWWTHRFAHESARLADESYAEREAAGKVGRSEWVQHARGQLVTAVYLADTRQAYGWGQFVRGLSSPHYDGTSTTITVPRTWKAGKLPARTFTQADFPELAGLTVKLVTLPLSQEVAKATGKKTLQVYVIEPAPAQSV